MFTTSKHPTPFNNAPQNYIIYTHHIVIASPATMSNTKETATLVPTIVPVLSSFLLSVGLVVLPLPVVMRMLPTRIDTIDCQIARSSSM